MRRPKFGECVHCRRQVLTVNLVTRDGKDRCARCNWLEQAENGTPPTGPTENPDR